MIAYKGREKGLHMTLGDGAGPHWPGEHVHPQKDVDVELTPSPTGVSSFVTGATLAALERDELLSALRILYEAVGGFGPSTYARELAEAIVVAGDVLDRYKNVNRTPEWSKDLPPVLQPPRTVPEDTKPLFTVADFARMADSMREVKLPKYDRKAVPE